jgi:hypothetical protein
MDENTKAELYKMYARAMKMMPGSSQQKELVKKIGALRKKLGMNEERDYKAEYKKFQSSTKSKKYRAELNKYNRKKGTYGNGDGKDASHKGGNIVGFESQSKNRGRAEKSRLKKEVKLNENPAAIAAATAMTKIKMKNPKTGKENSAVSALKDKDNPNHKKAKGIFAKLKDRFSKKKDDKKAAPKKQSKSDADFYKRQYAGESVNEAENKIADIRMILKTKKGKRIDSIFMDVKTAEEVMKHYKSLGRGAKERLVKQKIQNIVKSVKKANESVNEANQTAMYTQTFDKLLKKQTKGKQPTLKDLDRVYDLMRKRYKELDSRKYESINESWNQLRTTLVNIVRRKQYKKIDGVMVDMQTANLILKVWNALNSSNKSKFEKLPIKQMANVAWKLMK